jgi:mRNA-degrading endonuclease toxin of MazEF toxin-antitoxin module
MRPGTVRASKSRTRLSAEGLRSIGKDRLMTRWGEVQPSTLDRVADCVRILLGL